MTNQAQTLLNQKNNIDQLRALARMAAVKVFVSRLPFEEDTKKYQFKDGSELVIEDSSAYVVS